MKKVSLELGGKSPLIIFADCDLNKAVQMVRLGLGKEEMGTQERKKWEALGQRQRDGSAASLSIYG